MDVQQLKDDLGGQIYDALKEGLSLEDVVTLAKEQWVKLNEGHATDAVVVTYIIDEPEYLTLEEAEVRALDGDIHECDTHGLHLNEKDEFFHWKYKAYHLERAPNERERSHMLAKMMGVQLSDDTDEYE